MLTLKIKSPVFLFSQTEQIALKVIVVKYSVKAVHWLNCKSVNNNNDVQNLLIRKVTHFLEK